MNLEALLKKIRSEVNDMYDSREFTEMFPPGTRDLYEELMRRLQIIENTTSAAQKCLSNAVHFLGRREREVQTDA